MTLSTVIHTYNSIGGIDQSDQMTTFYPTERKRIKKWSKKHFIHLTSISSFNASIIHKKKGNKLDTLNFCTTLVKQIVEKYRTIVKSSVKCRGGRPSLEGNPFYLADRHLILIPPPDKKDKPTWCCIVCHKHEHEQRKESWCLCRQCSELFCIVPCFDWYHYEKILDEHYIRKLVYRFGT